MTVISTKIEHRVGIHLRLLHVGDMGGLKDSDPGARNVLLNELAGLKRRCRIVAAGDDQGWGGDPRQQRRWSMSRIASPQPT